MKNYLFLFITAFFSFTSLHANPNLIGIWTATVEHNRSFDTYRISLLDDGRSVVRVNNDNNTQETTGNWSYDGTFLRLNATFRNASLSHLPNIAWTSIVNFTGNDSFSILARNATNGTQTRITFFRSDDSFETATFNNRAIPSIFNIFAQNIPRDSRLAIVGITATDSNEASFYVNELTLHFVNTRNFTVVERSNIEAVFSEHNFQMSGMVADEEMLSIGRFIGANVVVSGEITGTGSQKRLVLRAIDVLTSEILSMASVLL
ncbi:MAG: CsgG/HfaB family protein [Treponema sp.]|nr:CsgG/HfaB family protein [Treponema sp.]